MYVLHKLCLVLRKRLKRVSEGAKKDREKKESKKKMWEHLRAPDILWKHCGPKIRRSRDSILSSEANHVIRRRRLAYFYSFCTSLKMKK